MGRPKGGGWLWPKKTTSLGATQARGGARAGRGKGGGEASDQWLRGGVCGVIGWPRAAPPGHPDCSRAAAEGGGSGAPLAPRAARAHWLLGAPPAAPPATRGRPQAVGGPAGRAARRARGATALRARAGAPAEGGSLGGGGGECTRDWAGGSVGGWGDGGACDLLNSCVGEQTAGGHFAGGRMREQEGVSIRIQKRRLYEVAWMGLEKRRCEGRRVGLCPVRLARVVKNRQLGSV